MLMQVKIEVQLNCPICSEQKNKMWSLKSLVMLECESRTGLHMQYNISDSQALYWCSALIIVEMASLDTLFLCSTGQ